MTRPDRHLLRMGLFLVAVLLVAILLHAQLLQAFRSNPALNGLIVAAMLFGIVYIVRQVAMLRPEVEWLDTLRRGEPGLATKHEPKLLSPVVSMLGERRGGRMSLSAMSTRTILDSIESRLDESREISRYLIGLLIFLGLLGTFWGLLRTIGAVGSTIGSLSVGSGDFASVFEDLKQGLEAPLGGMSVAFSSSLFGLAGSLVLGFLELQASQAQNRFTNKLEEWLSSHTRLSGGGGFVIEGEAQQSVPAYVQALLEQTADSLDNLQRIIARAEEGRSSNLSSMNALTERLAVLTDQMRAEQDLMVKLAEHQMELKPVLQRLAGAMDAQTAGLDEASRGHLRNVDVYLQRLLSEVSEGRNQTVSEIRSEIKLLARTIAALAEEQR